MSTAAGIREFLKTKKIFATRFYEYHNRIEFDGVCPEHGVPHHSNHLVVYFDEPTKIKCYHGKGTPTLRSTIGGIKAPPAFVWEGWKEENGNVILDSDGSFYQINQDGTCSLTTSPVNGKATKIAGFRTTEYRAPMWFDSEGFYLVPKYPST